MTKHAYLFIFFLLLSCSSASNKKPQATIQQQTVLEIENSSEDESDCIFDQSTQTDAFLKRIPELENYKWNSEEKVATIILDSNDTLLISRGGCYQFGVSAEFRLSNDTIDYSDWKNVYAKVLWISELLQSEFAYPEIKNALNTSEIEIDNDYIYFSNEYLQDNNYELTRRIEGDKDIIVLSYYIN